MDFETDNSPGFFWCVHHNTLLEWCYDPEKRSNYIRTTKPANEVPIRLKEMQRVKGKIPDDVVAAYKAADEAWNRFCEVDKACNAWDEDWKKKWDEAWKEWYEASKALDDAKRALDDAILRNRDYLENLHLLECPDSVWNGKELVF